ncbi:TetR family transcriptional regulator [Roseivirga pacifica]|uniref:TetR family transcriptional regulator n=1 Tax=Roseivirga pacifica TaxID=1267423 RepID=UPI003BAE5D11
MGRKSLKDVRRQEIVQAFYTIADAQGLHNTSIAMIAEEMDVNPSLILHYFKSKDELLLSLIDYILDKYLNIYRVNTDLTLIEQLEEMLDNLFSTKWDTLVSDHVYYSCYTMIFRDPVVRKKYKQLHDSLRVSLKEQLAQAKAAGIISVEDPEMTAKIIYTVLEGAYYYICMEPSKQKRQEIMKQYKQHALQVLGMDYAGA